MFHTPAHKVAPSLPQAGTIEFRRHHAVDHAASPDATDILITSHGSVYLVSPQTVAGNEWCSEHISHAMRFGFAYAVEHGCIGNVVNGMTDDGMVVA